MFALHLAVTAVYGGSAAFVWPSDDQHPISTLEAVSNIHESAVRQCDEVGRWLWCHAPIVDLRSTKGVYGGTSMPSAPLGEG